MLEDAKDHDGKGGKTDTDTTDPPAPPKPADDGNKPKGHGRNGAGAYAGVTHTPVAHESLHRGDTCPDCTTGKVYPMKEPAVLVRVRGMAPLNATVTECERLRCNGCNKVFTAATPAGVGTEKYDASADAMVAMLRYGAGVPFNRIERLERGVGIPLPASTQWDLVNRRVDTLTPVHDAMVTHAAQGEVFYNDDTSMTVLELGERTHAEALAAGESEQTADRTGVRTAGIVAQVGDTKVALYFTGRQLAGEGLDVGFTEKWSGFLVDHCK